jgi:hypothetical protein
MIFRNPFAKALLLMMPLLGFHVNAQSLSKIVPSTPHITLTATQSETAPGGRTKVGVVIQPGPDTHVYAPGAEKFHYQVVSLIITPSPAYKAAATTYPKSEQLHLPELGQTVPVYSGSTALSVSVVAKASPVTINGVLHYQPCTSKVCFPPTDVPLTWTVHSK